MDINILEENKTRMVFELDEDHAFCQLLVEELNKDKTIKIATYNKKHPLIDKPRFIVEGSDVKKSLKEAAKNIGKNISSFRTVISKEL